MLGCDEAIVAPWQCCILGLGRACPASAPVLVFSFCFCFCTEGCCRIKGGPNKHNPGSRPMGTGSWQSKLPQHPQRNCSHWHHHVQFVYKTLLDLLLHQSRMRATGARTQYSVQSQTALSLPGSWSARVRTEPSQPLCAVLSSIPSLLQRQRDGRSPFCQQGCRAVR